MKTLLSACVLFLLQCAVMAQTLTGKVVDEFDAPIQDAHVVNTRTDRHAHANESGAFVLEDVRSGDTVRASFVGFRSTEIIIDDVGQTLTIVLSDKLIRLDEIVISPRVDAIRAITDIDIQVNPVQSSQEVLRSVPGLFIGQHAGGGKAEQIFLRGFDIDHGTDINISVDGLPVNLVSHAHGQGYADLHFVIPETIDEIDFGKGPYYQDQGNFTTAGYVDFSTKEKLAESSLKLEAGQFDTYRMLGMFNLLDNAKQNAYLATEYLATDGPFNSPQNFNRINLFGKYSDRLTPQDKIGFTVSHFTSRWDASGQVPERAVNAGLIDRFGAIDDTEGGQTSRSNLLVNYDKIIDENSSIKTSVFLSQYDFELYSNFTFFLEDPINGDQIRQKENRTIYGLNAQYNKAFAAGMFNGTWEAGLSLRNDQVRDNELSHTRNRKETLNELSLGDVTETNVGAYVGANLDFNKWTINPAVRLDYFDFQYYDELLSAYENQNENKSIVSPKLNILYNASQALQLYVKTGKGFHSNDARVVVAEQDRETLPAAYGFDVGFIAKPMPNMFVNMAYWHLHLDQEFVYVGDAGIVEPSGKTRRQGVDVSVRYQPLQWLVWDLDANYTHARSVDEPEGADRIPLAPEFTLVSGLTVTSTSGLFGRVNVRHLADRPANEDNSIVAEGFTVADVNLGYAWRQMSVGVQVQNLFDADWNEAQFATESRLQNELASVEEIHFTPGTPFFVKGTVEYRF